VQAVETYVISAKEFKSLFSTESQLQELDTIRHREAEKYLMMPDPRASTALGRPLYYSCFCKVQIGIMQAENLAAADLGGSSDPFVLVDMVDVRTHEPLSRLSWKHRTDTFAKTLSPVWNESISWADISRDFDEIAVRVRVFDADFIGQDTSLGEVLLPLTDLENKIPCHVIEDDIDRGPDYRGSDSEHEAWYALKPSSTEDGVKKITGRILLRTIASRPEKPIVRCL